MQDIEYLCRAGYYVLGFDYTGTDLSDGKKLKGLAQGVKSLSYAIDFIQKESDFKNADIYVVGHSWGGFSTLNVIKYHPEIRGIVAMSPFVSIFQLLKGMLPKKLYWLIPFVLGIEFISCGRYALVNAKRSLHNYQGKALIIHSKDDPMVNYNLNTEILQKKCLNKKVKYYIVDGKGHNPNYTKEAIQALQEYSLKLRTLSKEETITYKKSVDFHKLGELDTEVMNDIVNFINE